MLTNRIEQNVLHQSYKGDENPKEVLRADWGQAVPLRLSHVTLVTWRAMLTIIF